MPRPDLELLAPARDADIGIAAVTHGADAVYIGGPDFGARANAGNSVADIARLVAHAHRFHARIFVTLNTILRDDELEPARALAWQLYEAGVDALIVQDMGLLGLDLPPLQLHASTQTDIRTPAKARFLADVGFSQMVLARELSIAQIREIAALTEAAATPPVLEFFVHGALCVAYSGQCFISHAHTGRSANRGNCSQECRLPYTVTDAAGGIVAHDKHVLSLKDNDQSANLAALVDAGIRSFKIEGRYKDLGYVKNVTAHYRLLVDRLLEERSDLRAASSGRCTFGFVPDPQRNFNRGATDYFVNGRPDNPEDIGAFDTPKYAGLPLGEVVGTGPEHIDLELAEGVGPLHNGDGLTWWDLQGELHGAHLNTVRALDAARRLWRVMPNEALPALKDLKRGTALYRNRDMAWDRQVLAAGSAERRIPVDLMLAREGGGLVLAVTDDDGFHGEARLAGPFETSRDAARGEAALREGLSKLGATVLLARNVVLPAAPHPFVPAAALNGLRRAAVDALLAARDAGFGRLPRAAPIEPPVPFPEDTLSYLANVYNHRARDFYARHGVRVIEAAYESHERLDEVSLMITKHCVRWSMSLCPKQAKGVTGVQGTIRAEPLTLRHGNDTLTLRFDCKPCEMHVVGRIRKNVLREAKAQPLTFYRQR